MQVNPSPLKPWLQAHVKLPSVSVQVALPSQVCVPAVHSSMSETYYLNSWMVCVRICGKKKQNQLVHGDPLKPSKQLHKTPPCVFVQFEVVESPHPPLFEKHSLMSVNKLSGSEMDWKVSVVCN